MTKQEQKLARIPEVRTIADAWAAAVSRHLSKWGRSQLLAKHVGYALAAFKQGMPAETCAYEIIDLERRALRTVVEAL